MNKIKVNFEKYVELMEGSLKEKAVIIPHIKGRRILDFGSGSGSLLVYLKSIDESFTTIAIDNDPDMRALISAKGIVDGVYEKLSEVKGGVDTIIFNSVLHEVYSYGDRDPDDPTKEVKNLLKEACSMLLPGGRIIIRDGFLEMSEGKNAEVRIKETDFDVDKYIKDYPFGTKIKRAGEIVSGPFNDVKEFLNKLTWGKASYDREIQEKINFLSGREWNSILHEAGFKNIVYRTYMQPSYFFYLQKVAEITGLWDTHILITANKGE